MKVEVLGEHISQDQLLDWAQTEGLKHQYSWIRAYASSIQEWYNDKDYIVIHTSGSTGEPKPIKLRKTQMRKSALKTAKFFQLKEGMLSLHCLPSQFIAGKMMLIRALIVGMGQICIPPKVCLRLTSNKRIDFAAMTPMQLEATLVAYKNEVENIDTIILGGGPISTDLSKSLDQITARCYATFGMTETITHIAVAPVNGPAKSEIFTALDGITFEHNNDSLVINADHLDGPVYTNDQVKMIDIHHFKWVGRKDHVINSGGVKLHPEQIEKKLAPFLKGRFFIIKIPDLKSGESVGLVIESGSSASYDPRQIIQSFSHLDKLERPKAIYFVNQFNQTPTGKIIRSLDSLEIIEKVSSH